MTLNAITGLNFCQNVTSKTVANANCHDWSLGNPTTFITDDFWRATQTQHTPHISNPILLPSWHPTAERSAPKHLNTWCRKSALTLHPNSGLLQGTSLLLFASWDAVSVSLSIPWSRSKAEELPESPIQGKLVMPLLF